MADGRMIVPVVVAFGVGGAVGFFVASKIAEEQWREIAQMEIEDVKTYYREKYEERPVEGLAQTEDDEYRTLAKRYEKPSPGELAKRGKKPVPEPELDEAEMDGRYEYFDDEDDSEDDESYSDDEEDSEEDMDEDDTISPPKQEAPYVISYGEFIKENGYDKVDLYFYRFDEILCDVNDRVYPTPEDELGIEWLDALKTQTMTFVRNDTWGIDYEIHSLSQSFNDEVATRLETDREKRFRQTARQKEAIDAMSTEFAEADAELKRRGEKQKKAYSRPKNGRISYDQIPLAEDR